MARERSAGSGAHARVCPLVWHPGPVRPRAPVALLRRTRLHVRSLRRRLRIAVVDYRPALRSARCRVVSLGRRVRDGPLPVVPVRCLVDLRRTLCRGPRQRLAPGTLTPRGALRQHVLNPHWVEPPHCPTSWRRRRRPLPVDPATTSDRIGRTSHVVPVPNGAVVTTAHRVSRVVARDRPLRLQPGARLSARSPARPSRTGFSGHEKRAPRRARLSKREYHTT